MDGGCDSDSKRKRGVWLNVDKTKRRAQKDTIPRASQFFQSLILHLRPENPFSIYTVQNPFTMTITSDIVLDASKFNPENIAESTKKAAVLQESVTTNGPRWWEVGAEKYREMWELGQTPLPKPVYLPEALDGTDSHPHL